MGCTAPKKPSFFAPEQKAPLQMPGKAGIIKDNARHMGLVQAGEASPPP